MDIEQSYNVNAFRSNLNNAPVDANGNFMPINCV